jgi:hypothetical protein
MVINFDHDAVPVVTVPTAVLSDMETAVVRLPGDGALSIEFGGHAPEGALRTLPVDFMRAVARSGNGGGFTLIGSEAVSGDDESYSAIDLGGTDAECEYVVAHIAGMQDHSARYLLDTAVLNGETLRGIAPPLFYPVKPALPARVRESKLTATTMTVRRHDVGQSSIGFVATEVRVADLLTGIFHEHLTRRPMYWAPVYLTHLRAPGLRDEERFGRYLLNEEYMRILRGLAVRMRPPCAPSSLTTLASHWDQAVSKGGLEHEATLLVQHGAIAADALRRVAVDDSYPAAAASIEHEFGASRNASSAAQVHVRILREECQHISWHLRARDTLNTLAVSDDYAQRVRVARRGARI